MTSKQSIDKILDNFEFALNDAWDIQGNTMRAKGEAKAALNQYYLSVFMDIVDGDEHFADKDWLLALGKDAVNSDVQRMNYGRNELRAKLRAAIKEKLQ